MTPTIVLYDIDGTLITTGGAGRKALIRAFEEAFAHPDAFDFPFAGMTDRGIFRGGMTAVGMEVTDDAFDLLMATYLEVLKDEVKNATKFVVHPGIVPSVEAFRALPHVAVGLGTGNIEAGARIKLERAQLNHHFEFGGFGCDAEDRAELIAAGAARGAQKLSRPLHECRLVIIGDTPKDAAAAHANGGECIAVATGGCTREELDACGARWVFDSLEHVNVPALLATA